MRCLFPQSDACVEGMRPDRHEFHRAVHEPRRCSTHDARLRSKSWRPQLITTGIDARFEIVDTHGQGFRKTAWQPRPMNGSHASRNTRSTSIFPKCSPLFHSARNIDTRRTNLVDGIVPAKVESAELDSRVLERWLDSDLYREADRTIFGLRSAPLRNANPSLDYRDQGRASALAITAPRLQNS